MTPFSLLPPALRTQVREVCATCPDHDVANVTATLRKGSSLLASAVATGVRLHHVPVHEPLVRVGMHAEFRKAPAFEGETVYLDIYANTGDCAPPLQSSLPKSTSSRS